MSSTALYNAKLNRIKSAQCLINGLGESDFFSHAKWPVVWPINNNLEMKAGYN